MSTAQTNASSSPASAAARRPRPVASSGPTPRTSSRSTWASTAGSGCPGAAITNTGEHRGLTIDTVRSRSVVPSYRRLALSRPIRRDAPPANTIAASGIRDVMAETLVDGPGVLAAKQRLQCGRVVRPGVACRGDLLARGVVVCRPAHLAEDAHHHVIEVLLGQPGQRECIRGIVDLRVMDHDLVDRHVGGLGHLESEARLDDAVLAVGAERDWLAVADIDEPLLGALLAKRVERAVVEDRAVLHDLDQRGATMCGGTPQHLTQALAVGVQRPADERRLGAERQRHRVERVVQRAHRRGLGDLADLGGRRILALGQPVNPVVEKQVCEVHVAARGVDQVVAADRQRVAVTGLPPDRQVLTRQGQPGGDGRRATVDRVESIGLQVVREAARASDAGHERDVLAAQPEFGQEVADGVEDDVVTTTGAPPDLLVTGEVLGLLRLVGGRHPADLRERGHAEFRSDQVCHALAPTPVASVSMVAAANRANLALSISLSPNVPSSAASMMPSTSSAKNAMPSTLVTD